MPGVKEVLAELRERGLSLGVATSIGRSGMVEILEDLGIEEFFEACSAGDDVQWNKPAVDVYERSCELMGLEPGECVVVEDTADYLPGIEAAGFKALLFKGPDCDILSEIKKLGL